MNGIIEPLTNPVRVIHGAWDGFYPLAGRTVAEVQAAVTEPFGLPNDAVPFINGERVGPSHVLIANDTLEFVLAGGLKGALDPHEQAQLATMNEITPEFGNDEALAFAKALHRAKGIHSVGQSNTLHVYADGLLLFLEGSADRHLSVRDALKEKHADFAEARVESDSVFLVPMDVGIDRPVMDLPSLFIAVTSGYIDHRHEIACSLGFALGRFRRFNCIHESAREGGN